jgi:hypothetical protein
MVGISSDYGVLAASLVVSVLTVLTGRTPRHWC